MNVGIKRLNLVQVFIHIFAWFNGWTKATGFLPEIKKAQYNRNIGIFGNMVKAGTPAIPFGTGAFRTDYNAQSVVLFKTTGGLFHQAAPSATAVPVQRYAAQPAHNWVEWSPEQRMLANPETFSTRRHGDGHAINKVPVTGVRSANHYIAGNLWGLAANAPAS